MQESQTFSIFFPYDGFLLQFFFSGKAGSLLKLKMKIMRGRTSAFVEDISNMRLVEMKKMWKLIELKKSKTNYFVACRCLDGALNTSALRVSEKIYFASFSPIFLGDLSLFLLKLKQKSCDSICFSHSTLPFPNIH